MRWTSRPSHVRVPKTTLYACVCGWLLALQVAQVRAQARPDAGARVARVTADTTNTTVNTGPFGEPTRPSEPWPRRERVGVVLERPVDGEYGRVPLPPNVIPIQEARRLGLRPLPRRGTAAEAWPTEPKSPGQVDEQRFARALASLCPKADAEELSSAIISAARQYAVDPFLLAGVMYQQSQCNAQRADAYGIGLTRINSGMFQRGMARGKYRYGKPDGKGGFTAAEVSTERYPFTPAMLRSPKVNAYYAAALISVMREQCPAIDEPFGSVAHRHFVSHFVWGDKVRATLPEDEIMIARRRLLYYYAPFSTLPQAHVGNVALSSPLDAPPRVVIGVMGEPRDNGRRVHRGIDLAAGDGEPVRAMAPGIVTFAGVDLRERGLIEMSSDDAQRVPPAAMGPRGLFVRVQHEGGVESLYVHLASYPVQAGQQVKRGELLGVVGRSGVHASDAHLHLGIFVDGLPVDPLPLLGTYAVRAIPIEEVVAGQTVPPARAPRPRAQMRNPNAARAFVLGPERDHGARPRDFGMPSAPALGKTLRQSGRRGSVPPGGAMVPSHRRELVGTPHQRATVGMGQAAPIKPAPREPSAPTPSPDLR